MTEEIICRYKFQNNEKFNGKEYCTLFNEVCSDVEFVCDKNCQVYEDYKQLKRLEQENKELKNEIQILKKDSYTRLRELSVLDSELDEVGVMNNKYRSALEEIREMLGYGYIVDKINEVLGNESKQNNNTNPYEVERT